MKWLKPGGILFITDYCCGELPHSDAFGEYLKDRKYHLYTPEQYTRIIQASGFDNVEGYDATNMFVYVLNNELDNFANIKQEFIDEFSEHDYNYIVKGWKSKVVRCNDGDQKWGIFCGSKPKSSGQSKL